MMQAARIKSPRRGARVRDASRLQRLAQTARHAVQQRQIIALLDLGQARRRPTAAAARRAEKGPRRLLPAAQLGDLFVDAVDGVAHGGEVALGGLGGAVALGAALRPRDGGGEHSTYFNDLSEALDFASDTEMGSPAAPITYSAAFTRVEPEAAVLPS